MKTLLQKLKFTLSVTLLFLLIFVNTIRAETDIPAGDVYGTWTLANSPYRINGHITVPNDSILNIEPGVKVIFTGSYKLDVKGSVLAVGTAVDTITFTAENPSTGWQAVKFLNTANTNDTSKFIYCKLEYGKLDKGTDLERAGGSFAVMNFSKLVISHCMLQNNVVVNTGSEQSGCGGAIGLINASPKITNNTIMNNQCTGPYGCGGAIICWSNANPLIANNLISGNSSNLAGGIYVGSSHPILINNIITANHATGRGGGIHCYINGNPVIINNTIANNLGKYGGGIDCNTNCHPVIINSILYGNTAEVGNQVTLQTSDCDPDFVYCLIKGGKGGFADIGSGSNYGGLYEHNISCNPGFSAPETDNYGLSDNSYCISAGIDSVQVNSIWYYISATDFEGNPRPYPTTTKPDIGAMESVLGFESPITPQTNISAGDVSGTWTFENSPYIINGEINIPNDSTLTIEPGVVVIFNGHFKFNIQGRLLAIGTIRDTITFTSQDPETGWNGLRFINTPASNDSSKIILCRLQYGLTDISNDSVGGAIRVEGFDKLTISNCLITHNKTVGDPYTGGAGIAIGSCSPLIENNTICYNNAQGGHGGGIFVYAASNSTIRNNLIYKNQAFGGGGIVCFMATPFIVNNTITENICTSHGGSSCIIACSPKMVNNIIYGNDASIGKQFHFQSGAQASFYNCDIEGGKSAFAREFSNTGSFSGLYINNIDSVPLFADTTNDDFHLSDESPCISQGIDSLKIDNKYFYAPIFDFEGNRRPNPVNTTPDLGAIENSTGYINNISAIDDFLINDNKSVHFFRNYPNPFSFYTEIIFFNPISSNVKIQIVDCLGNVVKVLINKEFQQGEYKIDFEPAGLNAGVYYCQLITGNSFQIQKLQIIK